MSVGNKYSGFAIALAWPQTYCKQPGAWYDLVTSLIGVNHNNYYKVGHAALVLVDIENQKAHYFDFGRYHAPYKHGRVRSAETDRELNIKTIPRLTNGGQRLENFKDILHELQTNPACHGEGVLHASYCPVNFQKAFEKAHQMQEASPIPYGPFLNKGSNCSRFVSTSIMAGYPGLKYRIRLKYFVPFTATPISNVNSLDNHFISPKLLVDEPFYPVKKLDKHVLESTLLQPERHPAIPENSQWLSGEGAGSWFALEFEETRLKVIRYSPKGVIECKGLYENLSALDLLPEDGAFSISYPSNCKTVSIRVKDYNIQFNRAVE